MREFVLFLLLGILGVGIYLYMHPSAPGETAPKSVPAGKPSEATSPAATAPSKDVPAATDVVSLVACPRCQATGSTKCRAAGCANGRVICPGPCLKLSVGKWEHLNIPGHDPKELWQTFRGSKGGYSWTTAHIGEVIVIRDGYPANLGGCTICQGRGYLECKACKGTGKVLCILCNGRTRIPESEAIAPGAEIQSPEPPSSANPSRQIKLKDGRKISGRIIAQDEEVAMIKTPEGDTIRLKVEELATEP